ncbi:MAG: glycosyltransferase family 2 protein [Armatimonadetes bacterium]|nr:glycosyltransferase family 2 protein [Armatimonadota bacterium]
MKQPKAAIIIPAYNEAPRIQTVLQAAVGSKLASEVIVVSDGSKDGTAEVAARIPGVTIIPLPHNVGKGGAMVAGVGSTNADIIVFVDADLKGLTPKHIDDILAPIFRNECDMCIGVFRGGKFWSNTAQRIAPYTSGQRAMKREMFESIPYMHELRMGAEMAITRTSRRMRWRTASVVLRGVSNSHKEAKMGLMKGAAARAKMYREMARATLREQRRMQTKRRLNVRWEPPTRKRKKKD